MFLKSNVCHVALQAGSYQPIFLLSIKTGALSQHLVKILNQLFQSWWLPAGKLNKSVIREGQ